MWWRAQHLFKRGIGKGEGRGGGSLSPERVSRLHMLCIRCVFVSLPSACAAAGRPPSHRGRAAGRPGRSKRRAPRHPARARLRRWSPGRRRNGTAPRPFFRSAPVPGGLPPSADAYAPSSSPVVMTAGHKPSCCSIPQIHELSMRTRYLSPTGSSDRRAREESCCSHFRLMWGWYSSLREGRVPTSLRRFSLLERRSTGKKGPCCESKNPLFWRDRRRQHPAGPMCLLSRTRRLPPPDLQRVADRSAPEAGGRPGGPLSCGSADQPPQVGQRQVAAV